MLDMLAVILIVLWVLGMVSNHTFGGAVYLLVVVAILLIIVRLASGREA
jgi:Family of unknown function (DUF5670)